MIPGKEGAFMGGSERERKEDGFQGLVQIASKLPGPGKQPPEILVLFLVLRINPAQVRRRKDAPAGHSQNPSRQLNPITPRPTLPAVIYCREDPQGNK